MFRMKLETLKHGLCRFAIMCPRGVGVTKLVPRDYDHGPHTVLLADHYIALEVTSCAYRSVSQFDVSPRSCVSRGVPFHLLVGEATSHLRPTVPKCLY
jgi:hypothetical protein